MAKNSGEINIFGKLNAATANKCLASAKQISGGYMALTTEERLALKEALLENGTVRVYDTDLKADFRYLDGRWVEITEGGGVSGIVYDVADYGIQVTGTQIYQKQTIETTSESYEKAKELILAVMAGLEAAKPVRIKAGIYMFSTLSSVTATDYKGFTISTNTPSINTEGEIESIYLEQFIMVIGYSGEAESGIVWTYDSKSGGGTTGGIEGTTINGTAVPTVSNKSAIVTDAKSILYEDDGSGETKLKLPDDWITYLEEKAYLTPTLTLGGVSGKTVEYGLTASISNNFTHNETYIKNISGTLNLLRNGTAVVSDIAPAEESTSITYEKTETITEQITYRLQGTNSKSEAIYSNSIVFNCYKPCWYGADANTSITTIDKLTKKASGSLGTVTINVTEEGQYGYFVTAGTISDITSSGFGVPHSNIGTIEVTLNGLTVTYNVYRTDESLAVGEYTFIVS